MTKTNMDIIIESKEPNAELIEMLQNFYEYIEMDGLISSDSIKEFLNSPFEYDNFEDLKEDSAPKFYEVCRYKLDNGKSIVFMSM